tara:strand:- start:641 stop:937 length:297 start_codon:yes stop_codon:yes gene_type:complete
MDRLFRDRPIMDEGINVFLKVARGRVSSINYLSSFVDENKVRKGVTGIVFDSSAFILSDVVVLDVEPVLLGKEFLSSLLAFIQVKSENLYFVLPEVFV